jgi:hypothetical protein
MAEKLTTSQLHHVGHSCGATWGSHMERRWRTEMETRKLGPLLDPSFGRQYAAHFKRDNRSA